MPKTFSVESPSSLSTAVEKFLQDPESKEALDNISAAAKDAPTPNLVEVQHALNRFSEDQGELDPRTCTSACLGLVTIASAIEKRDCARAARFAGRALQIVKDGGPDLQKLVYLSCLKIASKLEHLPSNPEKGRVVNWLADIARYNGLDGSLRASIKREKSRFDACQRGGYTYKTNLAALIQQIRTTISPQNTPCSPGYNNGRS